MRRFGHKMSGAAVRDFYVRNGLTKSDTLVMPKHSDHKKTPVGTVQRCGVSEKIRVATTGDKSKDYKWRSVVVWEQAHGVSLPEGYKVAFRDGNRFNFDPDNLVAVKPAVINRMNFRKWNRIEDEKLHSFAFDECVLEQIVKDSKCEEKGADHD